MPQSSYVYAVARVRALENGLIGRDKMMRMAEGSLDDVLRTLVESGYGDMPEADITQCEMMIENERKRTALLIKEITPKEELTNLFLLKTDIHNLKILLKARLLGSTKEPGLLSGGVYDAARLASAVRDRDYRDLAGVLKEELDALEKELMLKEDPRKVSVRLDQMYHLFAAETLKKHKNAFAGAYFRALADFDNVLALLRVRAMDQDRELLYDAILEGGSIAKSTLLDAFEQPEEILIKQLTTGEFSTALAKGFEAFTRTGQIGSLEKVRDDALITLAKRDKYDVMTIGPVIGYLLARDQEAKCIRLLVTAKRNGLPENIITERLRELYG